MKKLVPVHLLIFMLSVASTLFAADDTKALLEARRVRNAMVFELSSNNGTPVVSYLADGSSSFVLRDNDTIASNSVVKLVYHNFNPFKITVSAKETSAAEPSLAGLGAFLDALIATSRSISGLGGAAMEAAGFDADLRLLCEGREKKTNCFEQAEKFVPAGKDKKKMTEVDLTQARLAELQRCEQVRAARIDVCAACEDVKQKIHFAFQHTSDLAGIKIREETAKGWVDGSTGRLKILETKQDIDGRKETIQDTIQLLEVDRERLRDIARGNSRSLPCPADTGLYAEAGYVAANAGQVIIAQKAVAKALGDLSRALGQVTDPGKWLNDTDYIFATVESDPALVKTVDLSFAATSLDVTEVPLLKQQTATARKMIVRYHRRLVSEFGAAVVYNDLKYPKYMAKEEAGKKTVQSDGFEATNVNAAATYNLLCNCIGSGPLFPGIQLGVSTAKDYPGLLAGIVLRFAQPRKFSIATGRIVTWYKDLDKLKVGSEIASANDLTADLKRRRSPFAWYLAAQYTF